MAGRLYTLLLRLLPRHRRARDGSEMALLFADLRADERRERGWTGVVVLWMKEVTGMTWFGIRERFAPTRPGSAPLRPGPDLWAEIRWAWRGVQARRWRAVFVVLLLAVTLAANAATFSVVDSRVFRPQPYPEAERIVVLNHSAGPKESIDRVRTAALHTEWRRQSDLFAAVGYAMPKTVFLTGNAGLERVRTADITVGLLDVLGVHPRWGRGFLDSDLKETGGYAALIREDLARQKFGKPERAVGQRMEATGGPLIVVGVMPADFAFPNGSFRIWRALDPVGPLTTTSGGGQPLMARLAPPATPEALPQQLAARASIVGQSAAGLGGYTVKATSFVPNRTANARQTMLILLLGGATCLLLTACANVASLELTNAVQRAPSQAIRLALGASRATLLRVTAMEGGLLIGMALVGGLILTWLTVGLVTVIVPESISVYTQNPINVDKRVIWYVLALAGVTWLVASLAPIVAVSGSALRALLALTGRSTTAPTGRARLREALTILEVGLAVALVAAGLLYTRSYQSLLLVDKGFDSTGLAVVSTSMPPYYFASGARPAFENRLMTELLAVPGIVGITQSSPPPEMGDSPSETSVEIDGRPATGPSIDLGRKWVDESYFRVVGLPLRRGRFLEPGDSATNVVVPEAFARRFWPDGDAVGHSFRGRDSFQKPLTVVGIVGDFRTEPTRMPDDSDTRLHFYSLYSAPTPSTTPAPPRANPVVDTGGMYQFLNITVRMDSPARLPAVRAVVQRLDPRLQVSVTMVDDTYAALNADVQLASRVVGSFSVVALLVAFAGLYGVVAFLVASRTREIGIRMALGADRRDITRMVLTSSARLATIGLVGGALAAFGVTRSIESQLFGVSRFDPLTFALVTGLVAASALAATWVPAHQAARIDPAITLRAD